MSLRVIRVRSVTGLAVTLGVALALGGCATGEAPGTAAMPTPTADPFVLSVGDCVASVEENGPTPAPSAAPLESLPVADCSEPHSLEVFASFVLPSGPFPGDSLIIDAATDGCLAEFESFVGLPAYESTLSVKSVYPTQNSWLNGDREVLCLISDPAGPTTGSLHGAQR